MVLLLPRRVTAPLVVLDNFNRTDGGLGSNWTTLPGGAAPQISSNTITSAADGVDRSAGWTTDTFNANQYAEIQADFSTGTKFRFVKIICRASTAADTYYAFMFDTTNGYTIRKNVAGVESLVTGSGVLADGSVIGGGLITFRFKVNGSTLEGFKNGVSAYGPFTDTSITATGSPGFMLNMEVAGTGTLSLDNFAAGNL